MLHRPTTARPLRLLTLALAVAFTAGGCSDGEKADEPDEVAAEEEVDAGPDEPEVTETPDAAGDAEDADVPGPICEPGAVQPECVSGTKRLRCQDDGRAWQEVYCDPGLFCHAGACVPLGCQPGLEICAAPKSLVKCEETAPGVYEWVHQDDCGDKICKNGKCSGGCGHAIKLGVAQDCASWNANFTTGVDDFCTTERLLALPSSNANQIAVFDIASDTPTLMPGSPFDTCANPSRILLDSDTNIVATCRNDGNVWKHELDGTVLWAHKLPGCDAARGVVQAPDGRLIVGCTSNGTVYALDPVDGEVLNDATIPGVNWLYGLAADDTGLYVADLINGVRKLHLDGSGESPDLEVVWAKEDAYIETVYGFAVDAKQRLWLGGEQNLRALDTITGEKVETVPLPSETQGVAVALDGTVWAAMANMDAVARVVPGGDKTIFPLPAAQDHPRGLALDPDGNVYTVNLSSNNASRIDGVTGAIKNFGDGALSAPYGYSGDMTGLTANCLIEPNPTWKSPMVDSGSPTTLWKHVAWEADVPPDATLEVSYRIDSGGWKPLLSKAVEEVGQTFQLKFTFILGPSQTPATLHWAVVIYE